MKDTLDIGDIIAVTLPMRVPGGHEQQGLRPALIIGLPENIGKPRFPIIIVIPLTSKIGEWSKNNNLYPEIIKGEGNIRKTSILLTDQILSIDNSRINGYIGTIEESQLNKIKSLLTSLFKLITP